jgi:hypothetical protein
MTIVLTANKIISREFTVNSLVDSQITPNRKKKEGVLTITMKKGNKKQDYLFYFTRGA